MSDANCISIVNTLSIIVLTLKKKPVATRVYDSQIKNPLLTQLNLMLLLKWKDIKNIDI